NGGVNFHGKHPGQSPKGPALPLDGFYAARSANTAPLQWQSFSPPRTLTIVVHHLCTILNGTQRKESPTNGTE
ncbi:MAG: hypothetical protein ACK5XB_10750, partial [Rhodospirillales bacterium]